MKNINRKHFSRPRRREGEQLVQNNLAYTPSQMMKLAENGISVTNHSFGVDDFFDGVPVSESTFNLPLDRLRGVDVADCWQAEQSIRRKAKNGLKQDIAKFGLTPVVKEGE